MNKANRIMCAKLGISILYVAVFGGCETTSGSAAAGPQVLQPTNAQPSDFTAEGAWRTPRAKDTFAVPVPNKPGYFYNPRLGPKDVIFAFQGYPYGQVFYDTRNNDRLVIPHYPGEPPKPRYVKQTPAQMRAADAAVRDAQRRIDSYDYRDYVDGGHASSSDDQTTDGNFNSGSIHDNYLSAAQNYRTAAGKLPGDDPRAQQWLREAKRMEQQARNLETNDLPTFNFSKPPPKTAQAPRNAPAQPAASSQCPGHCSMCQPHPNGAGIPLVCSATSGAGYAGSCNCKAHGH